MPINKPTIEEQVKHMLRPSVWGTHLELKAAATLFQFPIYVCTQQQQPHGDPPFSWSAVQPLSQNLVKLPHIIDEEAQLKEDINHIELYQQPLRHRYISTERENSCGHANSHRK